MLCPTVPIRVDHARAGTFGKGEPTLHTYIREKSPEMPLPPRPATVICPGGAYAFTSDREAEPIGNVLPGNDTEKTQAPVKRIHSAAGRMPGRRR